MALFTSSSYRELNRVRGQVPDSQPSFSSVLEVPADADAVKETGHPPGRDAVAVFKPADGKLCVVAHAQPHRCSRFRGLFQLKHGLPDGLVVQCQNGFILIKCYDRPHLDGAIAKLEIGRRLATESLTASWRTVFIRRPSIWPAAGFLPSHSAKKAASFTVPCCPNCRHPAEPLSGNSFPSIKVVNPPQMLAAIRLAFTRLNRIRGRIMAVYSG